jgi:hypothetical protein
MELCYGLDDRGIGIRVPEGREFSLLHVVLTSYSMGTVERPGREGDHSSAASAEVKKIWIYISTPPYAFMA